MNAGEREEKSAVDIGKLLFIFRKSIWLIILYFVICLTTAYLIIRYTKPLYESASVIKLSFESEANTLGLVTNEGLQSDLNEISGEIELLKSKLFLRKVADVIDYPVSYFAYGTYLVDERYKNNPVEVSFLVEDPFYYDRKFDITILDDDFFELQLPGSDNVTRHRFGEDIIAGGVNLLVEKTAFFDSGVYGRYYFTINSDDMLINYFQNNMRVQPENFNAKTIEINLRDFSRRKAQDFVTAIDTLYLQYTTQTKNRAIEQKIEFLDRQINVTEAKLEAFEDYFENFTIRNKTTSLEADISSTIEVLNALDSQRFKVRNYYNNVKVLDQQLQDSKVRSLNPYLIEQMPPFIGEALEEYERLVDLLETRKAFYNDETAVIRRIRDQVDKAKEDVSQLISEHLQNYEEELERLNVRIARLESTFVELPAMGTDYNKNRRLYALQENFLLSLRQSKMELEITRAGTVTDSIILSPASFPSTPVKPQKFIIIGIGFVLALVLSVVSVFIRYLLNNKVSSLRELEKITHVPLVGSIPEYRKEKLKVTRLVVDHGSKSAVSEALRTIRTNLEFLRPSSETKLISISSTVGGEGKTFVAVNLGAIIASSRKKTCIVDLDMRKPKVHIALGNKENTEGVSTLLIGKSKLEETIQASENENLYFVPAGPTPPNPSELILSDDFDKFLASLKEKFDTIILDTPPVGLVTDGVLAMKKSDIQLYVLKADYSKRSFIKTIENVKNINGFTHMGIILNGIPLAKNNYAYGHYGDFAHYGYGYGYYDEEPRKKFLRIK